MRQRSLAPRAQIAEQAVFVSHETFTPAKGGSAAAEIESLRRAFGPSADRVTIANTKGFTGHAMGAGIEDVLAVKALEHQQVPPIPNLKEPDEALGNLRLSPGGAFGGRYAIRLAAGFGSQLALLLWAQESTARSRRPSQAWLNTLGKGELFESHRTLRFGQVPHTKTPPPPARNQPQHRS